MFLIHVVTDCPIPIDDLNRVGAIIGFACIKKKVYTRKRNWQWVQRIVRSICNDMARTDPDNRN